MKDFHRGLSIALSLVLLLVPAAASAQSLSSISVQPSTVVNGLPVIGTVTLSGPAPAGGAGVSLTSSDPAAEVQGGINVLEGATTAQFVVDTLAVTASTDVSIEASYNGVTLSSTLTVTPRNAVRGVAGDPWADIVIGQPDFNSFTPHEVTNARLFRPGGVVVDRSVQPNRIYVYDGGNSRVLGLSRLGTCAGGPNVGGNCTGNSDCPASTCTIQEGIGADLVLGQPSFSSSGCNGDSNFQKFPTRAPASASKLCSVPEDQLSIGETLAFANLAVDGAGNLYVPDYDNHRVLRYNSPFTTDTVADYVWGQADFAGQSCNRGLGNQSPSAQSFCFRNSGGDEGNNAGYTAGVWIDSSGNLWVADKGNNRVLRFPKNPVTAIPAPVADLVLGQPDFISMQMGTGMNQMCSPAAVLTDAAGTLYVADSHFQCNTGSQGRVLTFAPPFSNGMAAAGTLGADLRWPTGLQLNPAGGIWVNDTMNNQFLLFVGGAVQRSLGHSPPEYSGLCGEAGGEWFCYADGACFPANVSCQTFGSTGVDGDGNVFGANVFAHDMWRFPADPPSGFSADKRIFVPCQNGLANHVGLSGFNAAPGLAVTDSQVILADNGRLLFWNKSTLSNGTPADGYVGPIAGTCYLEGAQAYGRIAVDRASPTPNLWAITNPFHPQNGRIEVYTLPLTNGSVPVLALTSPLNVLGGGQISWDELLRDGGIAPASDGSKVWVADPMRNRVFRIRDPLTNPIVDVILGQVTVSGTLCNQGNGDEGNLLPSRNSLCRPGGVTLDPQGNVYVSDHANENAGNRRLLEFDASLFPDDAASVILGPDASRVFGRQGSFTMPYSPYHSARYNAKISGAPWQPAFASGGQMVLGLDGYYGVRFPGVYMNPLASDQVDTYLNDYHSHGGFSAVFDSNDDLYMVDLNRANVLIYRRPLASSATFTLTVTKAGSGSGTVTSVPAGIDCGAACSHSYDDGTGVTLSTVPGPNSMFAGWSGDADCADGVVTMNAARTCTATFQSTASGDLIVSALTVPATGGAGLAISVTDTTKNQGAGSAAASTTKFYLSTNATWEAADVTLGSRAIPSLAAGATSAASTSVTIPAVTTSGTYYVLGKADADGMVAETNETNNTRASAAIKIGPDLTVSPVTVPATGGAGLAVTVTDTTKNQVGTSPAPASTTKLYLSTNTTWDAGDVYLGSRAVPSLAAGATSTGSTSLTIPAGTATGTYYVIAKADADGLIFETNETNNNAASAAIKIGPDLIVSALTAPATGGAGLAMSVTETTKNQGGGVAAASTTKFYLSTNTTWDAGDVYLGFRSIPSLGPGTVSTASTSLTIPAGTATGTYYVIAKADADGLILETTETNNTRASAATKIGPDLIVSALTVPATGGAGLPITVTDTTKNQGGGAAASSATKFYLSTNTTWDAGDTYLGSRAIPSLAAGVVSTASTSLTIPAGTASASYYVIGKADADGLLLETSETNNTLSRAIKIGPDLIVSPLTVPATTAAGATITVTDTTKNQAGMSTAPASTTKLYLSTNTTWDVADIYLGSRSIPSLAAGAVSTGSTSLTIPAGTATGTYYVIAKADADGLIFETSETNNTASGAIKIGPDLIVSVLTVPTSAVAGATITVTDTTKNQGGGTAAVSATTFYLSLNTTWEAGDTSLGSRAVPILTTLATSAGSTSVTIPAGTAAGAYYILARADSGAAVAETSETNNITSKPITITP